MDDIMRRISKVCEVRNIRQKDLQINGGGTRQTVSAIFNGRQRPNVDIIKALLVVVPDLNSRWLLIGEGEIFTSSYNTPTNKQVAYESSFEYSKKNSNEDSEYINTIMLFTTTIEKKDSKIEQLYKDISEKSEEIGSLKEQVKGLSSDADKDEKKGKRVAG